MNYPSQPRLTPEFTPSWIKRLICVFLLISLLASLVDPMLLNYFKVRSIHEYLSLSPLSFYRYYFWQPLSYFFINSTTHGIGFYYAAQLALYSYALWVFSCSIYEYIGKTAFLRFYLGTGIFIGLITILILDTTKSYGILSGNSGPLFALFTFWLMLYPETEVRVLFTFLAPARLIFAICAVGSLLINFSNGYFLLLSAHMIGITIGYLYGVIFWDLRSPFPITHRWDALLSHYTKTLRERKKFADHSLSEIYKGIKIFDFQTGQAKMDDDEFLDAMLSKVSLQGEISLTWSERKRMRKISKRKSEELLDAEEEGSS